MYATSWHQGFLKTLENFLYLSIEKKYTHSPTKLVFFMQTSCKNLFKRFVNFKNILEIR